MSTTPEGVKTPEDRKKKTAPKSTTSESQAIINEAQPDEAQDIPFEHGGHEYRVPADAFDDIEIIELLEDEKNVSVIRQILGPDQWSLWKDRNRGENGRTSATVAVPFLEALFKAAGQGN